MTHQKPFAIQPSEVPENQPGSQSLFNQPAILRKFEPEAAEAELRLGRTELERLLRDLDEAQVVRQETLRLQFSV